MRVYVSAASLILSIHAATLLLSILMMRELHKTQKMSIYDTFPWFKALQIMLILVVPSALTVVMGGIANSGEVLLCTSCAPAVYHHHA